MKTNACTKRFLLFLIFVLVSPTAFGAPGDLDTSFSTDGLWTWEGSSLADDANAAALDSSGKILVGGCGGDGFKLIRLTSSGQLDAAFGNGGVAASSFTTSSNDCIQALAIQTDGKIVAGGVTYSVGNGAFALTRYDAAGNLDATFGSGGMTTTDFDVREEKIQSLLIQPDGKIIAAGYKDNVTDNDFALARYDVNGQLDASFSGNGKRIIDFNSGDDKALALALQTDGKILVGGETKSADRDFAVARLNADGTLDTGFSGNGKKRINFGNDKEKVTSLFQKTDGSILAVGCVNDDVGLLSLDLWGNLAGFKHTVPYEPTIDSTDDTSYLCKVSKVQVDGEKILVAGVHGSKLVVGRITATLVGMDQGFGDEGVAETALGDSFIEPGAIAVQSDGRIVVAGTTAMFHVDQSTNNDFAVARFLGDVSLGDATLKPTDTSLKQMSPTGAVAAQTDLSVKMMITTQVKAGESLTYHVFVANSGPNTASSVTMTQTLPPDGIQFDSVTTTHGSCSGSGPITCNLGSLGANTTAEIVTTIKVKSNASGSLTSTATVTSPSDTNTDVWNNNTTLTVPLQ